jgi:hypothetical protein
MSPPQLGTQQATMTHTPPCLDTTKMRVALRPWSPIEQLACELFASGSTCVYWAEEIDKMGLQGEHTITSYSPPPAPPSPAPWYPPQLYIGPPTPSDSLHTPPLVVQPPRHPSSTQTCPIPPTHAPFPEATRPLQNATTSHDRN